MRLNAAALLFMEKELLHGVHVVLHILLGLLLVLGLLGLGKGFPGSYYFRETFSDRSLVAGLFHLRSNINVTPSRERSFRHVSKEVLLVFSQHATSEFSTAGLSVHSEHVEGE